ncbi:hypothetical protein ACCS88_21325 [Rhizobium ruizarguesonis]
MSKAHAVRHICQVIECGAAEAVRELQDAVLDGEVEARARDAEFTSITAFQRREWSRSNLSLRDWRHSILYWTDDHIRVSVDGQEELLRIDARGVELRGVDVLRLWPAQKSEETATVIQSAPRSGRMLKYDWPKAAMFLASRIWRDALTEMQARDLLKEWFAGKGHTPDDKELRNWVSEFFEDERKRGK